MDAPPPRWDLTRFAVLRGVNLVQFVAFLIWFRQGTFLVGADGLTPARLFLARVEEGIGSDALSRVPTLFWLDDSDGALAAAGLVGVVLSGAALLGVTSAVLQLVLWVLYVSIVNVGQDWYGYGWETLLCEVSFLAIFLCPWGSWSPRGIPAASPVPIFLFRWLTFRILLGAGLIKLRGAPCWTELTCLVHHYQSQPNPHPLSWFYHHLPAWVHAAGVLYNHLVELVLPWLVFGPRAVRRAAGVVMLLFQVILISSGNLAFLNWLTLVVGLSVFDDGMYARIFPRLGAWLAPVAAPPRWSARNVVLALVVALVAWRSVPVVHNLFFAEKQAMNRSYDPLHLVNTYGAFGSVGEERFEAVIQGTADDPSDPAARWLDYEFPCKPGDVTRRPCLVTPYHPHLDWQMWFVPLQGVRRHTWIVHLMEKLLRGEEAAKAQFSFVPFPHTAPRAVRVAKFRYRFTDPGEPGWWVREPAGMFVRPLTLEDPGLVAVMAEEGW
jgi:hypothetical protein